MKTMSLLLVAITIASCSEAAKPPRDAAMEAAARVERQCLSRCETPTRAYEPLCVDDCNQAFFDRAALDQPQAQQARPEKAGMYLPISLGSILIDRSRALASRRGLTNQGRFRANEIWH